MTPAVCLLVLTPALFLASSVHLSFAALSGLKIMWDLYIVSCEAGEADYSPHSFSGERSSFSQGNSFLVWNSGSLRE